MVEVSKTKYPLNPTLKWTDSEGRLTSEAFRIIRAIGELINNITIEDGEVTADKISVDSLEAISAVLGNVIIDGDLVVNGTLTTPKHQNNSITIFSGTTPSGTVNFSLTEQTIQTHVVTSDGGAVLLVVGANVGFTTIGASNFGPTTWRIRKNGTDVDSRQINVDDSWTGLQTWVWIDTSPGTSPNTYTLTTIADVSGPQLAHYTNQAVIAAFGGKK